MATITTVVTGVEKFITALGGAAGEAVALGLLHGSAQAWATGGIAVASAFLVYFVPNSKTAALVVSQPNLTEGTTLK